MKIYLASDIHLEFGDCELENPDQADLLILSGDICVARDIGRPDTDNIVEGQRSQRVKNFFHRASKNFKHVIYVMGNHEHYHGDFAKSADIIRNMLADLGISNVYLLDRECREIDDWLFIGGTLWTDFNNRDPLTLHAAATMMNDYRGVKNTNDHRTWKFLPATALADHSRMIGYIRTVIENRRAAGRTDPRVIVVGHHGPSHQSVHELYRHDSMMNGCFVSNLDEFILDHPEICLWTHGHTHHNFDYHIGSTRIVCNPRGYIGYEAQADTWQPQLIEL